MRQAGGGAIRTYVFIVRNQQLATLSPRVRDQGAGGARSDPRHLTSASARSRASFAAISAHAVVVMHHRPRGDPSPSEADIRVTHDLIRAGLLLKIELLDHIILGQRTTERPRDH